MTAIKAKMTDAQAADKVHQAWRDAERKAAAKSPVYRTGITSLTQLARISPTTATAVSAILEYDFSTLKPKVLLDYTLQEQPCLMANTLNRAIARGR